MRRNPSPFEAKLWLALKAKRLSGAKFRQQQVIGPYIADFACRIPKMLVVEIDGDTHAEQEAYDLKRTAEFERRGYQVIRFANRDVGNHLEGVLMTIAGALALPLSPALSPEGGRGQ